MHAKNTWGNQISENTKWKFDGSEYTSHMEYFTSMWYVLKSIFMKRAALMPSKAMEQE